jgi:hypothetical protein
MVLQSAICERTDDAQNGGDCQSQSFPMFEVGTSRLPMSCILTGELVLVFGETEVPVTRSYLECLKFTRCFPGLAISLPDNSSCTVWWLRKDYGGIDP